MSSVSCRPPAWRYVSPPFPLPSGTEDAAAAAPRPCRERRRIVGAVRRDVLRFVWPAGVAVRIPSVSSPSRREDAAVGATRPCRERRRIVVRSGGTSSVSCGPPAWRYVSPPFLRRHEGRMRRSTRRVHTGNGGGSWGGRAGCPPFRAFCRRVAAYRPPFRCRQERRVRAPTRRVPRRTEEIVGRSGGTSSVSCGQAVWRCGIPPFPVRSEREDAMGGAPRARAKRRRFRGFGGGTPPLLAAGTRVRGG